MLQKIKQRLNVHARGQKKMKWGVFFVQKGGKCGVIFVKKVANGGVSCKKTVENGWGCFHGVFCCKKSGK